LVARLALLILLLAVYLWWAGSSRPGGAFQAGAALTGVLLLLRFTRQAQPLVGFVAASSGPAVAGPLLFLAIGLLPLAAGAPFLDYPDGWAKVMILTIEAGLSISVGAALALLAIGGREGR
jgi:multisubunit Na+/H+ antiporter MnhB subunit